MPTPLTPHLVEDSLAALSEWSGDTTSIHRTIRLDSPTQVIDLVNAVSVSAESLGHGPVVEQRGTEVTFTLASEEVGGVSEVDIALASHIDNLAGRLAGAPPTPAPHTAMTTVDETAYLSSGAGRNHMPDLTVDQPGQSASQSTARRRLRRRGGPVVGVPSVTGGGTPMPGVAVPDEHPGAQQPGVETEQGPPRG